MVEIIGPDTPLENKPRFWYLRFKPHGEFRETIAAGFDLGQ